MAAGLIASRTRTPHDRQQQTGAATHQCQRQAFGQKLAEYIPASRPEGGAQRNFLAPGGRARQQHVADVGAGDQQHEAHGSEQNEQRGTDVAHHFLAQRNNLHVLVGAGKLALQATGNARHFRLRLLQSDTRFQPGKHAERRTSAISEPRTQRQRRPKLRLRRPEGRELEIPRHHPNHGVGFTAERHGPPNDLGVAGKMALPQGVAQHHFMFFAASCSSGRNMRPNKGWTPSIGKMSGVTCNAHNFSGLSVPVRFGVQYSAAPICEKD